jgi:hypothetical protein
MMPTNFLETAQKQFQYYKTLGEKTIAQLNDEQLFHQFNPETNSISIIVNHLVGNMLSRWTDFLISDGEKNGDSEIMNLSKSMRQELNF